MLLHHRVPTPVLSLLVPTCTPVWKDAQWRSSVLPKNTTQCPWLGLKHRALNWSSLSILTMRCMLMMIHFSIELDLTVKVLTTASFSKSLEYPWMNVFSGLWTNVFGSSSKFLVYPEWKSHACVSKKNLGGVSFNIIKCIHYSCYNKNAHVHMNIINVIPVFFPIIFSEDCSQFSKLCILFKHLQLGGYIKLLKINI